MEKVKLSKEQVGYLESALQYAISPSDLVSDVVATNKEAHNAAAHLKRVMDVDTLIRALYIGYEVEQTPEDKVRELFKEHWDNQVNLIDQEKSKTICVTIYKTLDLLGIKIEGVNDI